MHRTVYKSSEQYIIMFPLPKIINIIVLEVDIDENKTNWRPMNYLEAYLTCAISQLENTGRVIQSFSFRLLKQYRWNC